MRLPVVVLMGMLWLPHGADANCDLQQSSFDDDDPRTDRIGGVVEIATTTSATLLGEFYLVSNDGSEHKLGSINTSGRRFELPIAHRTRFHSGDVVVVEGTCSTNISSDSPFRFDVPTKDIGSFDAQYYTVVLSIVAAVLFMYLFAQVAADMFWVWSPPEGGSDNPRTTATQVVLGLLLPTAKDFVFVIQTIGLNSQLVGSLTNVYREFALIFRVFLGYVGLIHIGQKVDGSWDSANASLESGFRVSDFRSPEEQLCEVALLYMVLLCVTLACTVIGLAVAGRKAKRRAVVSTAANHAVVLGYGLAYMVGVSSFFYYGIVTASTFQLVEGTDSTMNLVALISLALIGVGMPLSIAVLLCCNSRRLAVGTTVASTDSSLDIEEPHQTHQTSLRIELTAALIGQNCMFKEWLVWRFCLSFAIAQAVVHLRNDSTTQNVVILLLFAMHLIVVLWLPENEKTTWQGIFRVVATVVQIIVCFTPIVLYKWSDMGWVLVLLSLILLLVFVASAAVHMYAFLVLSFSPKPNLGSVALNSRNDSDSPPARAPSSIHRMLGDRSAAPSRELEMATLGSKAPSSKPTTVSAANDSDESPPKEDADNRNSSPFSKPANPGTRVTTPLKLSRIPVENVSRNSDNDSNGSDTDRRPGASVPVDTPVVKRPNKQELPDIMARQSSQKDKRRVTFNPIDKFHFNPWKEQLGLWTDGYTNGDDALSSDSDTPTTGKVGGSFISAGASRGTQSPVPFESVDVGGSASGGQSDLDAFLAQTTSDLQVVPVDDDLVLEPMLDSPDA